MLVLEAGVCSDDSNGSTNGFASTNGASARYQALATTS